METITETNLELELLKKGKVRDTYVLDDRLLMVATDRLSAFDVVFNEGIPRKGEVLTSLSVFWFRKTSDIIERTNYALGRKPIFKANIGSTINCKVNIDANFSTTTQKI